ncbi:hypothetical protein NESM_000646400 [Novymonas esmeraldas]|uniref:Uncharacterized protein n=1 Tax=Novymonas esmeraldas TaxID=1808958 RepID=A0AAW0ETV2_9TRYP
MQSPQSDRDELLLYALRHPPANVDLRLPVGCASLERLDLASCPSPIPLYQQAERAARHAKGKRPPKFEFDMTQCPTLVGSSSGGVQRAGSASPIGQRNSSASPIGPSPRADTPSNPKNSSSSSPPRPTPVAKPAPAPADKRGNTDTPRLLATEQVAAHPAQQQQQQQSTNDGAATAPEANNTKGLLGHLVSAFRGLGSIEGAAPGAAAAGLNQARRASARPPSAAAAAGHPATATATDTATDTAAPSTTGKDSSARNAKGGGGILASMWNPLTATLHGARRSGSTASAAGAAKEELTPTGVALRMEEVQIPLCGTTPGTISANIEAHFGPVFQAAAEQRRASEAAAATAVALRFPRPPRIQLCEVVDSAPLAPFLDTLPLFAYESLLLATDVLLTRKADRYARELKNAYRGVFNISDEQHERSLANVTPPALRHHDGGDAVASERQRYLSELRPDAATYRLLCDSSSDDDFISRAEALQGVIERYPDVPGDTHVPFAIRAMVFAACLTPLYQLDLSTLSPLYSEGDVEGCLEALRGFFGILPQTEHFCHLHAQLLANDQCGSVEAQAVFLKGVARAVSCLGTGGVADVLLTPPAKYAYYVLQETFCLAAVPMPWLDSSFSNEMQRSVTAVFIETCLALPPCMLSAMVLVDDMPVLPPTSTAEDILLGFMEVFVNSGVFRTYAEVVDDSVDVRGLAASSLFQELSSSLDTKQKAYCRMLTRSFPLATMLIVPGRVRIGAYVLLQRCWSGLSPDSAAEVPKNYKSALDAFLDYLLDGCDGERRTSQSETLCLLLMRAAKRYLTPLDALARLDEAAHAQSAKQLLGELSVQWAETAERADAASGDIARFVRTVFGTARPPPLGGDPVAQQHARMCTWLSIVAAVAQRCVDGFPSVAAAGTRGKVPVLAAESERVRVACAELRGSPSLLPSGLQRLRSLVRVLEGADECLTRAHRQYDLVRRVTGAPAVPMDEVREKIDGHLHGAMHQLCDTLSIHVLTRDTISDLLSKFMRLDVKRYKSMKRGGGKAGNGGAMPLLHPAATMRCILDEVRRAFDGVCEQIDYPPAVRQLHYCLGHNFVANLFYVYVDAPDVFLGPADAPLILADLDAVRVFFFEVAADDDDDGGGSAAGGGVGGGAGAGAGGGGVAGAGHEAVQALRLSGAELLDRLYSVVQYVMSKPSAELATGGVGVPPLHSLPEHSDDSPWCQYIVRRVLEHRKDFKGSMWESYKARVRAK